MNYPIWKPIPKPAPASLAEGRSSKHIPHVLAGKMSLRVIREWREAVMEYALHNDIPEEKVLPRVLGGFKDVLISQWIRSRSAEFTSLSLDEFIDKLRPYAVSPHWAAEQMRVVRGTRMTETDTAEMFVTRLIDENSLLDGHELHMDDDQIRQHVLAHIVPELQELLDQKANELAVHDELIPWLQAVYTIDEKRITKNARLDAFLSARMRAFSAQNNNSAAARQNNGRAGPSSSSAPPRVQNENGKRRADDDATSGPSKRQPNTEYPFYGQRFVGRMFPEEAKNIYTNAGCGKCRELFVCHTRDDCKNGWPDANTYRRRTDDVAGLGGYLRAYGSYPHVVA